MEFSVLRSDFIDYLGKIVNLARDYKGPKPMLRNVLLDLNEERLKMVSSNEESEMVISVPVNLIRTVSVGSVAVPAASLFDICKVDLSKLNKTAEDLINFKFDEVSGKMLITRLGNSYEVNCDNPDLYPSCTKVTTKNCFDVTEADLIDILNATAFSMGVNDCRVFLNGMNMRFDGQNIVFLSSDSHRLSCYKYTLLDAEKTDSKTGVIVARNGIMTLRKLLTASDSKVTVSFGKNHAQFDTEKFSFLTKLIDGTCIDPDACFPPENQIKASFKVDREMLMAAVKSITVICRSSDFNKIIMEIDESKITLSTTNGSHEQANVTVPVENFDGKPEKIALNYNYLLDVLTCIPSKFVNYAYTKTASLISPVESSNYCEEKFIVMLVKL